MIHSTHEYGIPVAYCLSKQDAEEWIEINGGKYNYCLAEERILTYENKSIEIGRRGGYPELR